MTPRTRPRLRSRLRAASWTATLLAALVAATVLPTARAHADVPVVDATVDLEPGEALTLPMALHFHRLVTRYDVRGGAGGSLRLTVVPGVGEAGDADPAAGPAIDEELRGRGRWARLIPCCRDVAYHPFTLRLSNDGAAAVTADLRAFAVHDDFAVVAQRAEVGAAGVPAVLFLGVGIAAVGAGRRARREAGRPVRAGAVAPVRASAALFLLAGAAATTLAFAGALGYASGLASGMVAILADLPVPGGPFGSRAAFVMGLLLLAWLASAFLWIVGVARGAHRRSPWVARLGWALTCASLTGGAVMALGYDRSWVPPALAALLAVPLAALSIEATLGPGASDAG